MEYRIFTDNRVHDSFVTDSYSVALKQQAERNRRSVTQEAISLIESGIVVPRQAPPLEPPIKLKGGPLKSAEIDAAVDTGRE